MDAPTFPQYYETDTSTVKIISQRRAVILYLQGTSPKISYVDSRAVSQEYRAYLGKQYLRKISPEEYKNRVYVCLELIGMLTGEITQQNGVVYIICTHGALTFTRVTAERGDRFKYTAANVTLVTETQSYTGNLEIYCNRFGELRFGTLYFNEPTSTEFGIQTKIGVSGYVYPDITPQEVVLQKPLDTFTCDETKSFLYVYGIAVAVPNSFNSSFNLSFETE